MSSALERQMRRKERLLREGRCTRCGDKLSEIPKGINVEYRKWPLCNGCVAKVLEYGRRKSSEKHTLGVQDRWIGYEDFVRLTKASRQTLGMALKRGWVVKESDSFRLLRKGLLQINGSRLVPNDYARNMFRVHTCGSAVLRAVFAYHVAKCGKQTPKELPEIEKRGKLYWEKKRAKA